MITLPTAVANVLDSGFVRVVDAWGSDEQIIEAARMSTGKGFLGWGPIVKGTNPNTQKRDAFPGYLADAWKEKGRPQDFGHTVAYVDVREEPGDEKLLAYLWEHRHATPFEMAGATLEIKAPLFVFREWHRHRTQSYNEMSARYTPLPDENYVPTVERLLASANANKQAASTGAILDHAAALDAVLKIQESYADAEHTYRNLLTMGAPKELARLVVPVGRYSKMRASANLRNWLAFLTLRLDPAAQWEIRQYAEAVGSFLGTLFPRTWALFVEGRGQ